MSKVFIGGSRSVHRLNGDIRRRLDRLMEKGLAVVIGDANGADKAVQQYLKFQGYEKVEVFCSNGVCRHNLGAWVTRAIPVSKGARGFAFYSAKDEQMAREGSVGLMLWDGKSRGTLANIERLLKMQKKVVVYDVPGKEFVTLKDKGDFEALLARRGKPALRKARKTPHAAQGERHDFSQVGLF